MGNIKNWDRNQELENEEKELTDTRSKKTIRVWENSNNNARAILRMNRDDDEESGTPKYSYTFEVDGKDRFWTDVNQQEAIGKATDWLEEHPYDPIELSGQELHSKLLEVGREVEPEEKGIANNLDKPEVETLVGTVAFFDDRAGQQTYRDLTEAQYRVFDWLGMMQDTDWDSEVLNWLFDELAKIYIQEKSVSGFVHQLRMRDLQVEMPTRLR